MTLADSPQPGFYGPPPPLLSSPGSSRHLDLQANVILHLSGESSSSFFPPSLAGASVRLTLLRSHWKCQAISLNRLDGTPQKSCPCLPQLLFMVEQHQKGLAPGRGVVLFQISGVTVSQNSIPFGWRPLWESAAGLSYPLSSLD